MNFSCFPSWFSLVLHGKLDTLNIKRHYKTDELHSECMVICIACWKSKPRKNLLTFTFERPCLVNCSMAVLMTLLSWLPNELEITYGISLSGQRRYVFLTAFFMITDSPSSLSAYSSKGLSSSASWIVNLTPLMSPSKWSPSKGSEKKDVKS